MIVNKKKAIKINWDWAQSSKILLKIINKK